MGSAVGTMSVFARRLKNGRSWCIEGLDKFIDVMVALKPIKWHIKRNLYDWWKCQILDGATGEHRYFCIMTLALYAVKCDIDYNELKKDIYDLIEFMNHVDPAHEFS